MKGSWKNEQKNAPNAVFPSHKNFIETIFHFSNNLKPELKKSWTADIILCGMPPSEMGGVLGKKKSKIYWGGSQILISGGTVLPEGRQRICRENAKLHNYNLVSFVQFKTWKTSMEECYFK